MVEYLVMTLSFFIDNLGEYEDRYFSKLIFLKVYKKFMLMII